MRSWDSSALVPLFIEEPGTEVVTALSNDDADVVAWWGTLVECVATFSRIGRQGQLSREAETSVRERFLGFAGVWLEVEPSHELRAGAMDLASLYPLRAADALQLSAARIWAGGRPAGSRIRVSRLEAAGSCVARRLPRAAGELGLNRSGEYK